MVKNDIKIYSEKLNDTENKKNEINSKMYI